MLYTIQSDIISLLCFYYSHVWSKYSINKTGCLNFTCCQYSSKDGSADRYPVSRTLCSSWKILHMGITSISSHAQICQTQLGILEKALSRRVFMRGGKATACFSSADARMHRSASKCKLCKVANIPISKQAKHVERRHQRWADQSEASASASPTISTPPTGCVIGYRWVSLGDDWCVVVGAISGEVYKHTLFIWGSNTCGRHFYTCFHI